MAKTDYNKNSILALGSIPADTEEGRAALRVAYNTWHLSSVQAAWPRALQCFENAAFLVGNHYTRFFYDNGNFGLSIAASTGQTPRMGPAEADVVPKVVDNRLPRATEAMTGLLTEIEPSPRVAPNSTSPEDEDAADLGEIVLGLYFERPLNMPAKLRESAVMGAIFEFVAAETEYAETGEAVEVPVVEIQEGVDPVSGQTTMVPVQTGTTVEYRRDETVRLWSSLHVTVDPAATSPEDLTWIARTTFEDVDWIRERFEQRTGRGAAEGFLLEKGGNIPIEPGSNHPLYWFTRIQDLLSSPMDSHGAGLTSNLQRAAGPLPNQTTFTVIDVKPTAEFPRGRTLIWAGNALIYAGDARAWSEKYPWRWHSYSFWSWFRLPGRFAGMPMLSELVPLQKRINAIDYLVQKNREHMAIGQWWLPKHSKVKVGSISGMVGEQYEYTDVQGLGKPERVQNAPLPAELLNERDQLTAAIEYISATGALDEQIAQSAARAGVVLDFLRSEKLRNKGPMIRNFEAYLEGISQNVLIDLQLNLAKNDPVLTERVKLAAREHSSLSIQTFTGASLRDHHSVVIDIASELRHSPEAREQRAMEYLQYKQGNITPAENLAILEATGLSKFIRNESDASIQRARRMIARIEAGMLHAFLPMQGIDDPMVMAPEFQRALLSDRWIDHPREVQDKLLEGFDHYRMLAEAIAQAAKMEAMAAQGMEAPPGMSPTQAPPGAAAGPPGAAEPEAE